MAEDAPCDFYDLAIDKSHARYELYQKLIEISNQVYANTLAQTKAFVPVHEELAVISWKNEGF